MRKCCDVAVTLLKHWKFLPGVYSVKAAVRRMAGTSAASKGLLYGHDNTGTEGPKN